MASSEASTYISTVEWGDEGYYLKEFTRKFQLPRIAKIIKGQYRSIGVPTLPSPSLNQIVLLASAGTKLKLVAQCVKFKDTGRRAVPIGSKLLVPENYEGWFEILSEDGYSSRCIESVAELAKISRPCLVRDSLKVYVAKTDDVNAISDKTRTLSVGEVLNIEQLVPRDNSKNGIRTGKFLKCISSHGDTVYLPFELRGKFSAIAGEQNISGVHSVKNLMTKRLPFMVRLVHGKPPAGVKFVPEMRLLSFVEEETLVAMPLSKDNTVVPLPQNAALKVLAPRNYDSLVNLREHDILVNRCLSLGNLVSDCIQVCTVNSINGKKNGTPQSLQYTYDPRKQPTSFYGSIFLVDTNSVNSLESPKLSINKLQLQRELSVPADLPSRLSEDYRYDEIDKIYDYVRGFAPLPLSIKNDCSFDSSCDDDLKHVSLPQIGQSLNNLNYPQLSHLPQQTYSVRRQFKSSSRVYQPPLNGLNNLVNRTECIKTKGFSIPPCNKLTSNEPIYEKVKDHRRNDTKLLKQNEAPKGLLRSHSTSKVTYNDNIINSINNFNQKKHSQFASHNQRPSSNPKQQRLCSSFNSQKDGMVQRIRPPADRRRIRVRKKFNSEDNQNHSTSPLFHIRYKSLTDLLFDDNKAFFNPPNYSSGNSYESNSPSTDEMQNNEDHNSRWLMRPKSLSNLVNNDSNNRKKLTDNRNCYAVIQNDINGIANYNNSKFYTMPDGMRFAKKRFGSAMRKKKFETMYL